MSRARALRSWSLSWSVVLLPSLAAAQQTEPLATRVAGLFRAAGKPGAPGGAVLVARGGEVLLRAAWGLADLERAVPLTADSVFDIGSTSKQFTAACVLLLEQDGALRLVDPVRRYVPELPACTDPVTLRHLLLHTSGIPDYIGRMRAAGHDFEDRTTADDALQALAGVEALQFPAGSRWAYSNSNYFLLAEVVARVAGRPLAEIARERIFVPLGMTTSHVHTDCCALVPGRAFAYSRAPGGWRWDFSNWEQTGDGAVFTTVGDLLRWSRNSITGTVGGEALRAAMAAPGALDDGTPIDYGMGVMFTEVEGRRAIAHGGAWAGYRAELLRVLEPDVVVACLCNRTDMEPSALARRIAGMVLAP